MFQTPEHDCSDPWLVAMRMMLALVLWDEDAYERARLEIGDCPYCWRTIAQHALRKMAEEQVYLARGKDQAAADISSVIGELVGVGRAGEHPSVPDDASGVTEK